MSVTDDFYVTLLSDENSEYSDTKIKNTGVFTNKLPSPLILNERYKVALTEIYVPPFYLLSDKKVASRGRKHGGRQTRSVNDGDVLEIYLTESDFTIRIENPLLSRMKKKHFKVGSLLLFFITRMEMFEEDELYKHQDIFDQLTEKLIKILNNLDLNVPYTPLDKTSLNGYFYLDVPYKIQDEGTANETFLTKEVIVPVQTYSSFEKFMKKIIKQVPVADRNIAVFVKALVKMKSDTDPKKLNYFREALETNVKTRAAKTSTDVYESVFFNKPEITEHNDDDEIQDQAPISQPAIASEQNEPVESEMVGSTSQAEIENRPEIDPQLGHAFIRREHAPMLDNLHMLFIYSDIIEHSIYAHHLFKILRIIPFYPEKVREGVHASFTNPEYYAVTKTFIDSISIIINNRGEELQFLNETMPIYLKLHFKKV